MLHGDNGYRDRAKGREKERVAQMRDNRDLDQDGGSEVGEQC